LLCSITEQFQHVVSVRGRINLGKGADNGALPVDDVAYARCPAGVGTVAGAQRQAHLPVNVGQQQERVAEFFGEGLVLLDGVEADTQYGYVLVFKLADSITESVTLDSSTGGVGLGVEPQHYRSAPECGQRDLAAVVGGKGKVGDLGSRGNHAVCRWHSVLSLRASARRPVLWSTRV